VITAASAAAAVGSVMTAAAAPESILACVNEAAGAAAVADMLAAMAAAAIAKGAVALPEVGGATGVSVTATATGIAVAIAFVAVAASCCAEAAGSVEEPAAEVSAEDEVAADFAVSDVELLDFPLEGCGASELALEGGAAPEGGAAAEVFWLPEPLLVDGAAGAVFCDPPLVAAAGVLSEGDCQAGCGGGVAVGLLASLAVLLSTSAPKISFPAGESDLAARGGAL
jgi:hypothetical protein